MLGWLFASIIPFAHAAPDLPADYRQKVFTVENPLVLEYPFGSSADNKATLSVVNYPNMKSDLFFFHMHMNETTAKKSGEEMVRRNGGTFMYLSHARGTRNMTVKINNRKYEFDPNRIFTDYGLAQKTQPKPNAKDLKELQAFVDWLKRNIRLGLAGRARPMVTALHNNSDDDSDGELLSIQTEKKLLGIDNQAVNANTSWDIDNFYIATLASTYTALVGKYNPNISLRLPQPRDIGYLSNWMITEQIEYLNVETQMGDLDDNLHMVEMIQALFQ